MMGGKRMEQHDRRAASHNLIENVRIAARDSRHGQI
jgi:hypothetical protein